MQSFYKVLSIKNYEIYKETKKYKLYSGKKESIRTDWWGADIGSSRQKV